MRLAKTPKFDYMRLKNITFAISAAMAATGVIALVLIALGRANLGVDFAGGSLLQYKASQDFSLGEVRKALAENDMAEVDLQKVEDEQRLMIKIKKTDVVVAKQADKVGKILSSQFPDNSFVLEGESEIGSSVSSALRDKALIAILISFAGIIVYLAFRFDIRFGIAATVATFHDIFVVIGICWLMNMEFTLLIVTALLTLAGYSLNDTVVVFDRIRENHPKTEKYVSDQTINNSINQVLSRTLITGLTTLFTLTALLFWGGAVLHDFAFVLLVGILIGTYSSIFVASPVLTLWKKKAHS